MKLNTITFMSLRCTHYFLKQLYVYKQICTRKTYGQSTSKFNIFATVAFLWVTKKKTPVIEPVVDKSILDNADSLFENGHYEQCYNILNNDENSTDVEIQWRLCRVLYNMSKESKVEVIKQKELIFKAYNIISELLEKNWDNYAVQKWYAILLDAKSSYVGMKEKINQLEKIKKHMDLAVTLNPNDATTLYMLGEWCYQVTELPWYQRKIAQTIFASPPYSSYEDALEYFLRAEDVNPRFYSLNLLRIGNCYLKLHKDDQAKYYLKLAASYPAKSNDDHLANREAAEILKKFK